VGRLLLLLSLIVGNIMLGEDDDTVRSVRYYYTYYTAPLHRLRVSNCMRAVSLGFAPVIHIHD